MEENYKENALDEFKEVINACKHCNVLARIVQAKTTAEGLHIPFDISETVLEADCEIQVSNGFIYTNIIAEKLESLLKIRDMFRQVLERGTSQKLKGKGNDYILIIDFVKTDFDNETGYTLSISYPIFMAIENIEYNKLNIATSVDTVAFEKVKITRSEVDYEAELETDREAEMTDNETINDDILNNDNILNNDDFLKFNDDVL